MLANNKMLLVTLVLTMLLSEQHFSIINAYGGPYRVPDSSGFSKIYNEKMQQERHHRQPHHQQHQHQHRHQHHISHEIVHKNSTKYWQHHAHHRQQPTIPWLGSDKLSQQQQQQHVDNNDRVNPVTTMPTIKESSSTTTTTTTTTTTINSARQLKHHSLRQQQHHHHHHQPQHYLQYQHASSKPTTTHLENSNSEGQRQSTPIVSTTMASRLAKVSTTSSSSSSTYEEQQQPTNSLSTATDRKPKRLSDEILALSSKSSSTVGGNHLDDEYDRERSKSVDDYANDYYYDEDDAAVPAADDDVDDDEDDDTIVDEYDDTDVADLNGLHQRSHHHLEVLENGPPRIIRDHRSQHHQFHLSASKVAAKRLNDSPSHSEGQLINSDQDYADDEPYRSSAENSYQSDAPGVLTEQKFRELGTMEAAQQEHEKLRQEQEQMRRKTPAELAREHMDRMKISGRCSRPLPRVIHVSNETSKRYIPYCTILHRCGEDTGCCDSTRQICAAKSWEDVQVYFFVIKVSSRSNKRDTEVLLMRNHTECHCVDRSNVTASQQYMLRDKRSDLSRRYHHQHHLYQQQDSLLQHYQPQEANAMAQLDAANSICRCPKHFDIFPDDALQNPQQPAAAADYGALRCRCDCLSHNQPCRRLQIGEEGFAVEERICIADRICQAPTCLHGDYSQQTGRCPRHKNQKRTITRYDYGYG